jgi:hypothetical protein
MRVSLIVAAMPAGQAGEGAHEVPTEDAVQLGAVVMPQVEAAASMADVPRLGMTAMSQEETSQMVSPPARMEVGMSVMVVMSPELSPGQVAAAMVGQMEESMLEALTVETAQSKPSPVPTAPFMMGWAEAGTFEASAEDVATSQVFMPMSPTPAATGQTVLEEALPHEGSASLGVSTRLS